MAAITTVPTAPIGLPRIVRRPLSLVPARSRRSIPVATVCIVAMLIAGLALALASPVPAESAPLPTVVVAEGDTMWSIAVEQAPPGEAASYVEQLVAHNGFAVVSPGVEVELPHP